MKLEARQKMTKATQARSRDERVNSRCAKTIPTKTARFFVHCLGRIANNIANIRPATVVLEVSVMVLFLVEERSCSSLCFSCVIVDFSTKIASSSNKNPSHQITTPYKRIVIKGSNKGYYAISFLYEMEWRSKLSLNPFRGHVILTRARGSERTRTKQTGAS